eukprot:Pgem_evm1s5658
MTQQKEVSTTNSTTTTTSNNNTFPAIPDTSSLAERINMIVNATGDVGEEENEQDEVGDVEDLNEDELAEIAETMKELEKIESMLNKMDGEADTLNLKLKEEIKTMREARTASAAGESGGIN